MDERPHNLHNHDEWWTELLMEPTLRCMTQDATRAWRPRLRYRVYASSQNHVFWYTLQLCIKRTRALNTHLQDKTRLFCFCICICILHLHLHLGAMSCWESDSPNSLLGERTWVRYSLCARHGVRNKERTLSRLLILMIINHHSTHSISHTQYD